MKKNKFKFDFDYIKKNCNQKKFLKDIVDGNGDMFLNVMASCFDHDLNVINNDFVDYEKIADDYDDKKNQEFKLTINKSQFDGTLLPKLSDDFKLELHFDFGIQSYYIISSKIGKCYLYIYCERLSFFTEKFYNGRATTVYDKHGLTVNFVKTSLKKKLTMVQFFELIMEWDKKVGLFQKHAHEGYYTSTDGLDYYELYKKDTLKFLEKTPKKINKTFIFDDLVQNFDLKKFIKCLDNQCEVKMTNPPHYKYMEGAKTVFPKIYEKPPDIYFDLLRSCVNKNMSFEKLRDDIYKSSGDLIHSLIESGKLLPGVSNNFQLVYNDFQDYFDNEFSHTYGFTIISSKINNNFYLSVEHDKDKIIGQEGMYYCMKRFEDKNSAIKFVKAENKNLKKYYKKFLK